MNGSSIWDHQKDIRKIMFYCLVRSIFPSLYPWWNTYFIISHDTLKEYLRENAFCYKPKRKKARLPIKKCGGNGNKQDIPYYYAYITHSHFLSPNHLILFFCNQIIVSSFPAHASYFMYLPCIYLIASFCLEFQTKFLLTL